jgi:hypothetical protein
MSVFIAYQVKLMDLIERDKLTFRALSAEQDELLEIVSAMSKERRNERK